MHRDRERYVVWEGWPPRPGHPSRANPTVPRSRDCVTLRIRCPSMRFRFPTWRRFRFPTWRWTVVGRRPSPSLLRTRCPPMFPRCRRPSSIAKNLTCSHEWLGGPAAHNRLASRRRHCRSGRAEAAWASVARAAVRARDPSAGGIGRTRCYLAAQQVAGSGLPPTGQLAARDRLAGKALSLGRTGLPALTTHRQEAPRSGYQPVLGRAGFGCDRRLAPQAGQQARHRPDPDHRCPGRQCRPGHSLAQPPPSRKTYPMGKAAARRSLPRAPPLHKVVHPPRPDCWIAST